MLRLLTFESFIPKNIEKRTKDFEIKHAKDLKEFEAFIKEFRHNLSLMKDKKSEDHMEQLFIDLIKDCSIKLDQEKYPFCIFLFDGNKWMFEYDWKEKLLWFDYNCIWEIFESKFNIDYQEFKIFILNMMFNYFKFKISKFVSNFNISFKSLEKYFNNIIE
jgi:hypothetical protein